MTVYRVVRASDDVIAAPGQTVTYDDQSNTWVPTAPGGGSGGASSLAGLSDVDTTGASEGDVLTREGGAWVAAAPTGGGGGGALVVVTGSTTIPAGSTEGELVGYRNSSGSPVDVSGTELASGEWGVWAWLGGAWVLLSTGVATGGITDTTPPTGGTLAVSGSGTAGSTRTLTVTGAADETALHAAPYRFSLDGGATWTGWQSSASWTSGPLDAGTYQPRATVRDAAGNTVVVSAATFGVDVTPDTTAPTPGTLASSAVTASGFTLTVTGASDETGLHAAPYAFSTDGGGTYSAWQAAATFEASGLDPETLYSCRHKVRDAALNEALGTAIDVTTDETPADTDPPTPGTLASSAVTDSSLTLTVTGASDSGSGLHAQPYAFSLDDGSTWSAWQSAATYDATDLDAATLYPCKHKVRDASLNEATGTKVDVTTEAAAGGLPLTDTFTAPDSTDVVGRTVSGFTWALDTNNDLNTTPVGSPVITGNAARTSSGVRAAVLDVAATTVRVSAKVTVSADAVHGAVRLGLGGGRTSGGNVNGLYLIIEKPATPEIKCYWDNGTGSIKQVGSAYSGGITAGQTKTVSVEYVSSSVTVKLDGVTIITGGSVTLTGTKVGFSIHPGTAGYYAVDDFTVEAP